MTFYVVFSFKSHKLFLQSLLTLSIRFRICLKQLWKIAKKNSANICEQHLRYQTVKSMQLSVVVVNAKKKLYNVRCCAYQQPLRFYTLELFRVCLFVCQSCLAIFVSKLLTIFVKYFWDFVSTYCSECVTNSCAVLLQVLNATL